jgi:hypothetical protein
VVVDKVMTDAERHAHRIHGVHVSSEVALPEPSSDHDGDPDLVVCVGPAQQDRPIERPDLALRVHGRLLYEACRDGDGWWLRVPGYVGFDVREDRIVLRPFHEGIDPSYLQLLLSGTGLSFWLMAYGRLCLHASAVEVGDGWIALAGRSGAGKSTLAALCCAAGHPLVADDLLRVETRDHTSHAYRGASEIRLRDAARVELPPSWPRRATADDRVAVAPPTVAAADGRLRALVLPRLDRGAHGVSVERLAGLDAVSALSGCLRLSGWSDGHLTAVLLQGTMDIVATVPVVRATVPWSDRLGADLGADLIESLCAIV